MRPHRKSIGLAFAFGVLTVAPAHAQSPKRLGRDGIPLPPGAIARLGTLTLRGCGDPILYTPGGKYFVTTAGPSRSQVAFFDPATGKRLFELATSGTGCNIRFSPDGHRMVCPVPGSYHNPVWDVEKRRQLFKFEGSYAAFSADGARLIVVSCYGKGHCRILDGSSGQVLDDQALDAQMGWAEIVPRGTTLVFHDQAKSQAVVYDWARKARLSAFACAAAFGATASPDGKTLALASREGIRLVELATGKELANWKQRADGAATFAPDGRRIAWSGYDEQRGIAYPWVADVGAGGDVRPRRLGLAINNFSPPCFTPDGKELVVLEDGGMPVWRDVESGKETRLREAHTGTVWQVAPLADGRHVLSCDHNRWLVWNLQTARLVKRYPDDLPAGESVVDRVGRSGLLTLFEGDRTLRVRDAVIGRELLKLEGHHGCADQPVNPTAGSRNGKVTALVSADYHIRVYDLVSGRLRLTHDPKAAVWSLSLSDDGRYLTWLTQSRPGGDGPFLLDTETGKDVTSQTALRRPPPGLWRFWGQEDGLKLLSAKHLVDQEGRSIDRNWLKSVFEITTSPDEHYLAIYHSDVPPGQKAPGRLGVWDLTTGRCLYYVQPPSRTFRFSPESRLLATTSLEGTVDVWEVATGQKRLSFAGHLPGKVPALAFLSKGRMLASGGRDGQVMLWDMTGRAPDGNWHEIRLGSKRLQELWALLATRDAGQAHAAIYEMIADPAGTVSFLEKRLDAAPVGFAERAGQLIADLDSPTFSTRQRATVELAKWGEAILPELRAALKKPNSLEQARRLGPLIAELERGELAGERLRGVRAVEVLEAIGTPEARGILKRLAHGLEKARLTREAKNSLKRLPIGKRHE